MDVYRSPARDDGRGKTGPVVPCKVCPNVEYVVLPDANKTARRPQPVSRTGNPGNGSARRPIGLKDGAGALSWTFYRGEEPGRLIDVEKTSDVIRDKV